LKIEMNSEQLEQHLLFVPERIAMEQGRRRGRPPAWMTQIKRRGRLPGSKNKPKESIER
jgi:hypothetical protein